MSDNKYNTKRINLQAFENLSREMEDVSDASDISELIAADDDSASKKAADAVPGDVVSATIQKNDAESSNASSAKPKTEIGRAKRSARTSANDRKQKPAKKKSAFGAFAFVFFLLALIFAGYLFGLHYNLFPDYLATYIDKAVPSADIIPERHQVRTFEMLYAPEVPDAYTELMLMRKTEDGTEGYLAYAFTNSRGEVEYRAYARRITTEYSLVTDKLAEDATKHNNRAVSRITDNDGKTILSVYTDETTVVSVDEGFVRIDLKRQESDTEEQYYGFEIVNEEEFYDPEKEETGKCRVKEIPVGYEPTGAEGIEPVEAYTSLFRIPVSIYTDKNGTFETYYVYYIYGDFEGEKTGFYPATKNGNVIPGGLRNEILTIKESAQQAF